MIIYLKKGTNDKEASKFLTYLNSILVKDGESSFIVTPSSFKELPKELEPYAKGYKIFNTDIQLASKEFISDREVRLGANIISRAKNSTALITGPCSVESPEQIKKAAKLIKESGLSILRAGSFKPRTSPYSFQGLGTEGLKLLEQVRAEYGVQIITEARDATHIDEIIEYADIVQIGAKAMYDQGILKRCGKTNKPVLLKRGFGSTLREFVQAAEYILSGGNPNVILCERGIRTFENNTRFTLDLCGVAWLKEHTGLPIILDPSHAIGASYGVPDLARACMAMGVEGLLIEVHPNPENAKSDAAQQLSHIQFKELLPSLKKIAEALGRDVF